MKVGFRGKSGFLIGGSLAVLAIAWPQMAMAQDAPGVPASETASGEPLDDGAMQDVVVVGVRQSEQSAINRKRTARTAQDSIVADDVGQFPDKNAAEAIARIAGVALNVADSGEQGGFTIRGQSADLVRVEVDGMSTLSSNGDQGGRVATIGELSSDLIKSVDVIKGQTADMTPGGVGGTVRIEQRSGLDFTKPLYRLNAQLSHQSLSQSTNPRITAIAAQRFFNGRLGVLLTGTYEELATGTDYSRVALSRTGYVPLGDLDNSAEKSFTTPFDPLAAGVTTKAGCAALPTTGINSRLNCYAQWEDFVPSFVRPGRQIRGEKRYSIQARVDWRATDDLVVFASYNPNIREVSSQDYNWSIAQPIGTTNAAGALATSNIRNVVVNENHYVTAFDMVRGPGVGFLADPTVTTQVRDIQRQNNQYYTQGGFDFDSGPWSIKGRVQYSLAKNQREDRAFQFYAPIQAAEFRLVPETGLWSVGTPGIDLFNPASYYPVIGATGRGTSPQFDYIPQADRNSEWNYQLDAERRFEDFGPLTRIKVGVQHRVRDNDSYREPGFLVEPGVVLSRARSLDQIQACDPARAPAATPCVFGSALRSLTAANFNTSTDRQQKLHTLTVAQYQDLINASLIRLPGANFFAGAPNSTGLMNSWGTIDAGTFFDALSKVADTSAHNIDCLYECLASDGKTYKRPPYHTDEITSSAYAMADFEARPFGVLFQGNVGVRYQRIKVNAAPIIDFSNRTATPSIDAVTGLPTYTVANVLIRRESGLVDRTSEDWLPSFNLAAWPIEDVLGIRYSIAKQRARPSMVQLTGNGVVSCGLVDPAVRQQLEQFLANNPGAIQDDDPNTDDAAESIGILNSFVNRCTSRIGNPELKGYGATTQNLSLEWYPNKDTQLTGAVYQIDVQSGRPETIRLDNFQLGGNGYLVDTFQDGPSGLTQRGFEVAGRTAFTFLPGFLKYTGGGFNYSYTKSNQTNTDVDPITGTALPPRSESKYYYNINLWYDDGRLSARVAYQRRAAFYEITEADAPNRIPATPGIGGDVITSYYKYISPVYKSGAETLDGRVSFNLTPKFSLFAEGKNLLGTPIDKYTPTELRDIGGGVPYMFDSLYQGRTYYAGAIFTF